MPTSHLDIGQTDKDRLYVVEWVVVMLKISGRNCDLSWLLANGGTISKWDLINFEDSYFKIVLFHDKDWFYSNIQW